MALTDQLMAYWSMDEASGNRADSHSGGYTLTDNNAVGSTTGKISNAATPAATGIKYLSRADTADLSMGNIDFTITGWFWIDDKDEATAYVKGDGDDLEYRLHYDNALDRFVFTLCSGTGFAGYQEEPADVLGSPSTGTWYFIACWHDATADTINIKVNNGTTDSASYTAGSYDSAAPLEVGTWSAFGVGWDGRIDEMGIWKRVLTADELTSLYNSGNGLAYGDFDAGPLFTVVGRPVLDYGAD